MPIYPDGSYPVPTERVGTAEQLMVRPNPQASVSRPLQRLYLKPSRIPKWVRDGLKRAGVSRISRAADIATALREWGRETARLSQERFIVMVLNVKNQPTAIVEASLGTLDASLVHPRDVFGAAIAAAGAQIIVAHNHPSGDPEPSPEDIALTRRLAEAGELLGIPVLDSIVIGREGYVSLAERGVI